MASDLKVGRRRATSNAASSIRSGHARRKSKAVIQPKSTHTADEFLQDFLDPTFDPATFLNSTLPPLQQRSVPGRTGSGPHLAAQHADIAAVKHPDAAHRRHSEERERLAYEVELLRGETLSLQETMNETLQDDIRKFVPEGLKEAIEAKNNAAAAAKEERGTAPSTPAIAGSTGTGAANVDDPEFIKQLQTLTLVRSRLDSVIKTFGDAMEFVFPPSEVSVSSGFLSVSAPEPGSAQQSSEEKGQEVLKKTRTEISDLLNKSEDPVQGIEKAAQKIEHLKELTLVWKDTAEEKGRNKFIESLAKMVEDRHRDLMKEMEQAVKKEGKVETTRSRKGSVTRDAAVVVEDTKSPGGFGLISQLQKLRSGL
ncbi:hypothetical protein NM208_g2406 [Fusarium decemcellulare]|uniref:Uncharacterized protein n=1 Tax=Fusarium decemcellulare TaxID=57161 RepID=A0ACC1SSI9_9HYPO|nr:hypothetical protein NM208_g2406 [Fusarium decemcellulare]